MARVDLSPIVLDDAGVDPGAGTAGAVDGHMVELTGREILEFNNSNASPQDVTLVTPQAPEGLAIADRVISVPATNGRRLVGDLNRALFGQDSMSADAGKVYINYPAGVESSITTRVYRLPG